MKAISVAFETSAASLEGLLRSGEGWTMVSYLKFSLWFLDGDRTEGLKFNCPTCSLIKEGSYMSYGYGNMCPDCGATIV